MNKFKFNIGETVRYSGTSEFCKSWFSDGMSVCGIIPVGDRTSSGEINRSSETLYRVKHGNTYYVFPESELRVK